MGMIFFFISSSMGIAACVYMPGLIKHATVADDGYDMFLISCRL